MDFHLETDRLYLRSMTDDDFPALCAILQDPTVMTAYEHAFSDQEAADWLSRQQMRYQKDGFGLWAVELKQTGALIGQCGITLQKYQDAMVPEIGYLFQKAYWHCGYATEAALACKQYAFETLQIEEVYCIIRDNNFASQKVAERNGMHVCGKIVKHYYGMDMPHIVYCAERNAN